MKIIGGESKSVSKEMTISWSETTLSTILSNYKLDDISNVGEFDLFYQCLPDKTYHLKGEIFRLTEMAAASATGEKLSMFVIRKSKNLRCFKNVKHQPCEYKSQKKSWMNVRSLKSGSVNSTKSFVQMIEKLLLSLTIVQPIHQSQT